jgi:hypothetical protein
MAKTELPTPHALRQLLRHDPDTGLLYWRARPLEMFADRKQTQAHNAAIWNGRFAEKPAFSTRDKLGYFTGVVHYRSLKAHRVIWAMVHDEWPEFEIDHIDGDPANNLISNLRVVSHRLNGRNLRLKKNNTSGVCGVWMRPSGRWLASISVDGKTICLGTFDTKDQAAQVRFDAQKHYGFHENHGVAR